MTLCRPDAGPFRKLLDRIAFAWIVVAPAVALLAIHAGRTAEQTPGAPYSEVPAVRDDSTAPPDGAAVLLATTPDGLVPLPTVEFDVRIRVSGIMARGHVRQTFRNDTGAPRSTT